MTWPAVTLRRGGRRLRLAPLPEAPGMAVVTRPDEPRWAVVRLARGPLTNLAEVRRRAARAAPDLFRLEPFREPSAAPAPTTVASLFVHLGSACNLRCEHCYVHAHPRPTPPAILPRRRLDELVTALAPGGLVRVTLSGGEPLLHPGIADLVRDLRDRGLAVTLLTNAGAVTAATARWLAAAEVAVMASLHGPDAATHDRLAGAGSFAAAARGIARLGQRLGPARLTINCTLHDGNVAAAEDTVALAARLGAGRIRFLPLHGPRRGGPRLDYGSPALLAWAARAAAGVVTGSFPIRVEPGMTARPAAAPRPRRSAPCLVGEQLVVAPTGALFPCPLLMTPRDRLDPGASDPAASNAGASDPATSAAGASDAGGGLAAAEARRRRLAVRLIARRDQVDACRSCLLAGICEAGCPALARQVHGKWRAPDPLCAANVAYARAFFRLVAARGGS